MSLNQIVIDYENARQKLADLKKKRAGLIAECSGLNEDFRNPTDSKVCHELVYEAFKDDDNTANYSGHGAQTEHTYDELMVEMACDSCRQARDLRNNEQAQTRKQMGIVKGRLSAAGKRLSREITEKQPS